MPESPSHVALKELLVAKLREWYGASIDEYPSSGHELDVFAVTASGVSIYIEIIWSPSKTQFLSDINMLQQSDADVKLVVVNPEIMANSEMVREFAKVVVAQRRQGKVICGDLLSGQRIAEDHEYVDYDLRNLVDRLVSQSRSQLGREVVLELEELKVAEADWPGGKFHNVVGRVLCKGNRVVKRLRADIDFGDLKPDLCSVDNSGRARLLDLKDIDYSWSPDGTDHNNRKGEWPEMRQGDSAFVIFPDAVGVGGAVIPGSLHWMKHFLRFGPSSHYMIKVGVKGISGNRTISCENVMDFATQ